MQLPTLETLIEQSNLQAFTQNMNDTITQCLHHISSLPLPIYQQYVLLLLALPLLYFVLRPLTPGEDLHFMAVPMFSLCDDLADHIACNIKVLKHVKFYFHAQFQATRGTPPGVPNHIEPGHWHIIPVIASCTVLALGTLMELLISISCTIAMIAALTATTLLARDWRLEVVDWLDEGILQTYRHAEETVECTFLDSAFWAGLLTSDVVMHAVTGRRVKFDAGMNEVEEVEQPARLRIME